MINKKLILLIILLKGCLIFSQTDKSFKITYRLKYKPDTTNLTNTRTEQMILYSNGVKSLFLSEAMILKDSMKTRFGINDIGSANWKKANSQTITNFDFKIFKNKTTNVLYYGIKIIGDKLCYKEKIQFNWTIHDESKTVFGYKAQKATTNYMGRNYTAWFSQDLGLSDGPYKFEGLPGLILEISDSENHYNFEIIGFEKINSLPLESVPPKDYIISSKQELFKLKESFENDPINYTNNYKGENGLSINIPVSGKAKKEALKVIRGMKNKFNNPIEYDKD